MASRASLRSSVSAVNYRLGGQVIPIVCRLISNDVSELCGMSPQLGRMFFPSS
jgi:hypothetical protein